MRGEDMLFVMHMHTKPLRLIMRGWMLHQQPIITWGESVGLCRLTAILFFLLTPPLKSGVYQLPAKWIGARKHITAQIHSDNKSGVAVINSNLSRRMRDEGCRESESCSTLGKEWRDMREMSDVFKLHSSTESLQWFTGGCWEHVGGSVAHSKVVYLADANLNQTTTEDGCKGKRSDGARGGGEIAV